MSTNLNSGQNVLSSDAFTYFDFLLVDTRLYLNRGVGEGNDCCNPISKNIKCF